MWRGGYYQVLAESFRFLQGFLGEPIACFNGVLADFGGLKRFLQCLAGSKGVTQVFLEGIS